VATASAVATYPGPIGTRRAWSAAYEQEAECRGPNRWSRPKLRRPGRIGDPVRARQIWRRSLSAAGSGPWLGTFAVNMAGSALLGFLIGAQRHLGLPPWALGFAGTGFCGGLTTFSTFGYETLRLLEDGAISEAGVNVIGSPTVGILMAWLGFKLAAVVLARPQLPSVGSASAHT